MTPMHSPQGRLVLGLIATATTAAILFAGVLWWAVSPVVTPLPPRIQQTGAPVSATETKLAAERWTVELWRPLSDAPVAVAVSIKAHRARQVARLGLIADGIPGCLRV